MAKQLGEFVTAADVGRRLGVSPERIRQLAREGHLPDPVGRAGRNTLWAWETIADWATATGRLERPDRPSTQVWTPRRGKRQRFRRAIECVLEWGRGSTVHVRIWNPLDSRLRPVVLLGELDDNPWQSVTNGIEVAAMTVAAQLLGADGLYADWYEYRPDSTSSNHEFHALTFTVVPLSKVGSKRNGLSRRARQTAGMLQAQFTNPQWSDISREDLENLVGEVIEVYPRGAYTRASVNRRAIEGTFEIDWDPEKLRLDIEAAKWLLRFSEYDLVPMTAQVVCALHTRNHAERSRKNTKHAAQQHRDLAVELIPYAPSPQDVAMIEVALGVDRPELEAELGDPHQLERHQQRLRAWLSTRGSDRDRLLLVQGPAGLAWLDAWEVGVDVDESEPGPSTSFAEAVRHSDECLTILLSKDHPYVLETDFPLTGPSDYFDATGKWAEKYLATVSWWGPRDEDDLREARLRVQLERDAEYTSGYDPWGRLVLRTKDAFVVEWPVGSTVSSLPDEVEVVADQSSSGGSPVFLRLPDGRLDLLPAPVDERSGVSYTWGYGGGGPFALTRALHQLVLPHVQQSRGVTWDGIHELVVGWKFPEFRTSLGHLRQLSLQPDASKDLK